jgi:hypothetical protein
MTADLSSLRTLPLRAADAIERDGWTQGTEKDEQGRMCLTGALRECSQPGDWLLAREVYRRRDRAEDWNDADGRTVEQVLAELRREVTEQDLAETFGPQWEQIVALVRRAAVLTGDEVRALAAAWAAAWDAARAAAWAAAWDAARDAAWDAARDAARDAAWAAARAAARDAARDAAWAAARAAAWAAARAAARDAARDAAWAAASALSVRDLIGQHGFTQQHYDLLTRPWTQVIGPAHPDDVAVTA